MEHWSGTPTRWSAIVQDLTAAEADLQRILDAFGLDRDVEVFDVVPVLDGLKAETCLPGTALNAKAPETYLTVTRRVPVNVG